jgi:hypothetical protein
MARSEPGPSKSTVDFSPVTFPLNEKGIQRFDLVQLPQRNATTKSLFNSTDDNPIFVKFYGKHESGKTYVCIPVCITELGGKPTPDDVKYIRAMEWHNRITRGWMKWVDPRIKQEFKVQVTVAFSNPHHPTKRGLISLWMEGGLLVQYQREIATTLAPIK